MDVDWIDKKFLFLINKIGFFKPDVNSFFFEPSLQVYDMLQCGEQRELEYVTNKIANHIELFPTPGINYTWGITMNLDTAGKIEFGRTYEKIDIPFYYVGKKYVIGAIIAHELTHSFLIRKNIFIDDNLENEMLTDLATIFIGLGKLALNGLTYAVNIEKEKIGYLPLDLVIYAYKKVNKYRSISNKLATMNIIDEAKKIIDKE